jgi:hypothetical protein
MLIPKATLIATGDETQEPFDGSGRFPAVGEDMVELSDEEQSARIVDEHEDEWEPDFGVLDEEWGVEDDDA